MIIQKKASGWEGREGEREKFLQLELLVERNVVLSFDLVCSYVMS